MEATARSPGVRLPAPFVHGALLLLGAWGDRAAPWPLVATPAVAQVAGAVIVACASALGLLAAREFARARTSMLPSRGARQLILRGPYRCSRNPMYVGLVGLHLGIGVWVNSTWIAAGALPAALVVHWWIIPREERHLDARFGAAYRAYARRVRRWV